MANKMFDLSLNISWISLNVNDLYITKDKGWQSRLKKHDSCMLSTRNSLQISDISRLELKQWKQIYYANLNEREAGMTILALNKVYYRTKEITRDRKG
jgi:hypothetical protein